MEKIASFTINHMKLQPGVYVSRKDKVGEGVVTTFDLRMTSPNEEPVMNTAEVHAIEHLGATFLRNHPEYKDKTVYFGPMGCRTGFYLLSEGISYRAAFEAVRAALAACADMDEVPGAHRSECGNYREHDLAGAKSECAAYLALLDALPEEAIAAEEEKARRAEEGK